MFLKIYNIHTASQYYIEKLKASSYNSDMLIIADIHSVCIQYQPNLKWHGMDKFISGTQI